MPIIIPVQPKLTDTFQDLVNDLAVSTLDSWHCSGLVKRETKNRNSLSSSSAVVERRTSLSVQVLSIVVFLRPLPFSLSLRPFPFPSLSPIRLQRNIRSGQLQKGTAYCHLYLTRRVAKVSCSSKACDWTMGRKRSHSNSSQFRDK